MTYPARRRLAAGLMVVLLVASVMAVPLTATAQKPNPTLLPDDQVIEANSNTSVWERAIYPLRSDNTVANTTVEPPHLSAEGTGIGEKELVFSRNGQRNPIGIFTPGTTVDFDFKRLRAQGTSDLDNQANVQIVAARLEDDGDGFPTTFSEFLDLTDPSVANDNATFTMINDSASLDGDGNLAFNFTPSQRGHYMVFVSVHESGESGYSVDGSGQLSQSGNVTVLGVTPLLVQEAQSNVDNPDSAVEPGKNASFDIDASNAFASGDDVTHLVVVYEKDTFTGSTQRLKVDSSELDQDFNLSEDATWESSIAEVNGVATIDSGVSINGESLSDTHVSRAISIETAVDFLAEELQGSDPTVNHISPNSTLHASLVARSGRSHTTTIEVETVSDWSTGEYQWVHLAKLDDNATLRATNSGTFTVDTPPSPPPGDGGGGGGGSPGGGGGGGVGGGDGGGSPTATPVTEPSQPVVNVTTDVTGPAEVVIVDSGAGRFSVNITNITDGTRVVLDHRAHAVRSSLVDSRSAVDRVTLQFEEPTEFDLTVESFAQKPEPEVPDPPVPAAGFIEIDHEADDDAIEEVTIAYRVTPERLADAGIDRNEVALYRYAGGEWNELETRFVRQNADGSLAYESTAPGLSVFAIAQTSQPTSPTTPVPGTAVPPDSPPAQQSPPLQVGTSPGQPGNILPGEGYQSAILLLVVIWVVLITIGLLFYRDRNF